MDWAKVLRLMLPFSLFIFCQFVIASPPLPGVTLKFSEQVNSERIEDKFEVRTKLLLQHHYGEGKVSVEIKIAEYKAGQPGIALTSSVYEKSVLLDETIPVIFSAPATAGTYHLTAFANSSDSDGKGYSSATTMYIVISADGVAKMITPAEFKHKENTAKKLPPAWLKSDYTVELDVAEKVQTDPFVQVHSSITYESVDGVEKAMPYAYVDIWEDDLFFDDYLGTVVLDIDGKDSTWVNYGYDPFGTTEIYLVIDSANEHYRFGTSKSIDDKTIPYSYTTARHRVSPSDDDVYIDYKITGAGKAMQTWASFNNIWDYTKNELGFALPPLNIWFPAKESDEAYFVSNYNKIAIGESFYNGPMVMAHEFGHALMWRLYGDWLPEGGGPHILCPAEPAKVGLAWSEGYASAYGLVSNHSEDGVFYWHTGGNGFSYETYSCPYQDLNTDEARVAAALWDFLDEHDDCNGGNENVGRDGFCDRNKDERVSPTAVFVDGIRDQRQEDALEYWWFMHDSILNDAQEPFAQNIYKYNWVAYEDAVINSFTWKTIPQVQDKKETSCGPPYCYSTEAKWNAYGEECQLTLDGKLVSTSLSGVYHTVVYSNRPPSYLSLSCEGWGPKKEQRKCDPIHC